MPEAGARKETRGQMSEARNQTKGPIRHFSDLLVYRRAFGIGVRVFDLSRAWPSEEKYALIDQIRRSSRAVGGQYCRGLG
jgi:hypothetical protein